MSMFLSFSRVYERFLKAPGTCGKSGRGLTALSVTFPAWRLKVWRISFPDQTEIQVKYHVLSFAHINLFGYISMYLMFDYETWYFFGVKCVKLTSACTGEQFSNEGILPPVCCIYIRWCFLFIYSFKFSFFSTDFQSRKKKVCVPFK